jgi:hypothetical protein
MTTDSELEPTFLGLVGHGYHLVYVSIYETFRARRPKNLGLYRGEDMISFLLAVIWSEDMPLIQGSSRDLQTLMELVEISDALVDKNSGAC